MEGAGQPSSRASGVDSRVWSRKLQWVGFPSPTSKGGGKGQGVFREAQYPGRGGDGVPRNIPPTTRRAPNQGDTPAGSAVQIDQLIGLLTGLGCSAAVLG